MRPGPIGPGNTPAAFTGGAEGYAFNEARPNWAGKSAFPDVIAEWAIYLQ